MDNFSNEAIFLDEPELFEKPKDEPKGKSKYQLAVEEEIRYLRRCYERSEKSALKEGNKNIGSYWRLMIKEIGQSHLRVLKNLYPGEYDEK